MRFSFSIDVQITSNINFINKGKEAASFLKEKVSSAASRVIQFIQEKRPVIAKALRSVTLEVTAFLGISKVVKALLGSGPVSRRAQSSALGWSSYWGHVKSLKAVLDTKAPLLKEDREKAIENIAFYSNSLEVLNILLDVDPKEISQKTREDAIKNAASGHDCVEIMNLLLSKGGISEETREEAIKTAAPKAHINVVQALLAIGGPLKQEAREAIIRQALPQAVRQWQFKSWSEGCLFYNQIKDVVSALSANGPVSEEAKRGIDLYFAVWEKDAKKILNLLTSGGSFSKNDIQATFNLLRRIGSESPQDLEMRILVKLLPVSP